MTHLTGTRRTALVGLALAGLLIVRTVGAQPATAAGSAVTIDKAEAGSCSVTLAIATPRAGDDVGLAVDLAEFREQTLTGGTSKLEFNVGSPLEATAYLGTVVDTFAPDIVGDYKNPEAGTAQKLRSIFGVDFAYRLLG